MWFPGTDAPGWLAPTMSALTAERLFVPPFYDFMAFDLCGPTVAALAARGQPGP